MSAEELRAAVEGAPAAPRQAEPYDFDALLERAGDDAGAPFEPEAVQALAELRARDPAAFQRLRADLKKVHVRVGDLDRLVDKASREDGLDDRESDPKISELLIEIALAETELFRSPDRRAFADLRVAGHRETWPVRSLGFRTWLAGRLWELHRAAAGGESINAALLVLEAHAQSLGVERNVFVRVGAVDGAIYIDLGNPAWTAVEVTSCAWRVVEEPPVRFRRAAGMLALPVPVRGGSLRQLRRFLNLHPGRDFRLIVAWLRAVLYGQGPMPALVLTGEQGSAKSTFARLMRRLVDPNSCPLRSIPREERDLFIAASNGWLICLDNLSGLPAWLSDALCKLATGGGFAVRQLYTDGEEVLFEALRPAVLNGITDVVTRPDLADRALSVVLRPIAENQRRTEDELFAAFDAARPGILGALLDGVVVGLRELPRTRLERLPRMADFARFAVACETGQRQRAGSFMHAYEGMRSGLVDEVLESDAVAMALLALMETQSGFDGTMKELLGALGQMVGDRDRAAKDWPATPKALSSRLRRLAPFLRRKRIQVRFLGHGRAGNRIALAVLAEQGRSERSPRSHVHASSNSSSPASDLPASGDARPTFTDLHAGAGNVHTRDPNVHVPNQDVHTGLTEKTRLSNSLGPGRERVNDVNVARASRQAEREPDAGTQPPSDPPWSDLDAWRARLRGVADIQAQRSIVVQWARAAGAIVNGRSFVLPADLPLGYAQAELRSAAGRLGLAVGTTQDGGAPCP